jgi:hypothetical protein
MAAEPKTRPTDVPVEDFIAAVPNATRRADAEAVKAMLDEVTGEKAVMWGPSIVGYGSYRSNTGDWPRIGFSPRKDKLVFYIMPGFDGQDELLGRLGAHSTGGSCLYVRKLADVDQAILREIAARGMAEMRARYPA